MSYNDVSVFYSRIACPGGFNNVERGQVSRQWHPEVMLPDPSIALFWRDNLMREDMHIFATSLRYLNLRMQPPASSTQQVSYCTGSKAFRLGVLLRFFNSSRPWNSWAHAAWGSISREDNRHPLYFWHALPTDVRLLTLITSWRFCNTSLELCIAQHSSDSGLIDILLVCLFCRLSSIIYITWRLQIATQQRYGVYQIRKRPRANSQRHDKSRNSDGWGILFHAKIAKLSGCIRCCGCT